MFSRPVSSGLKPEPSSSSAAMRPWVSTAPEVGGSTPAMICSNVLFPLPFRPMMPSASPRRSSKLMSCRAWWMWMRRCAEACRRAAARGNGPASSEPVRCRSGTIKRCAGLAQVRKILPMFDTRMAGGASVACVAAGIGMCGKVRCALYGAACAPPKKTGGPKAARGYRCVASGSIAWISPDPGCRRHPTDRPPGRLRHPDHPVHR